MKRAFLLTLLALSIIATIAIAADTGGEVTFKSSQFSHASHVDEMGFPCEDCHDSIFEMKSGRMEKSPGFSMQAIYDGKFCGTCHDGDNAFASDENCTSCHSNDGGEEIKYKTTTFSHTAHIDSMGFSCEDCHAGTFEMKAEAMLADPDFSMQAIYDGQFCGSCHDGDNAFASDENCTSCHTTAGGDILFTKPVKAVIFSHETHGEAFECEACHSGLFEMEALAAQKNSDFTMESLYKGQYCGACHDGESAFASDTRCATCHIGVKGYKKLTASPDKK